MQQSALLQAKAYYLVKPTEFNPSLLILKRDAPNPYVTWQFNEQDGHRDYFWGHYHNEPDMAERDLHNRAEDYQRRYHVQEVEQAPDKETYKYYSTQRPIDIGTYPKSYFNRPIHMDV